MCNKYKIGALILAAGSGTRMASPITKQMMQLGGMSIVKRSVIAFDRCDVIDKIVVVAKEGELESIRSELSGIEKVELVVPGGESRAESAKNGLFALGPCDYVAIHDAARPLVTPTMIKTVVAEAIKKGCATAAAVMADTVKEIDGEGRIVGTLDRNKLVRATTPQIFRRDLYERAVREAWTSDVTDDNMLVERIGEPIYTVLLEGNVKITTKSDLEYAEMILAERGEDYV